MARDREQEEPVATETPLPLGRPLILAATFVVGAGVALAAKSVFESRRKGSVGTPPPDADIASDEDLPTALRRAALDVAIAATNEAAERLSVDDQSEGRSGAVGAQSP